MSSVSYVPHMKEAGDKKESGFWAQSTKYLSLISSYNNCLTFENVEEC